MKPAAIITGAASGLGKDLIGLLTPRYHLVLVDRDEQGLAQLKREYTDIDTYSVDLADADATATLGAELALCYPNLTLLVNNAGITHRSDAASTSPQVIRKVMDVDYLAPVVLTHPLLPSLIKHHGSIVNISSMAGWMPVIQRAGYCAAKAALHQYFETLRAELHGQLHILNVFPSFLATPIEKNALDGRGQTATHPRTSIGRIQSSMWMAKRICRALDKKRSRLYGSPITRFASVLYQLAPSLYHLAMRRQFSRES